MRVLFYQPAHQGHHFAYLARMLPGFVELPIEMIVATTPQALESEEFAKSLAHFGDRIAYLDCCTPAPKPPIANSRHRLRELAVAIDRSQPDHLALNYADGLWDVAYVSTLLGRRPWPRDLCVEGWLYRGRFADPSDRRWKSRLRRQMFAGLLRQGVFRKLHLHHELLYEYAAAKAAETMTSVELAPDPIVIRDRLSPQEARAKLGVLGSGHGDETWIGVAGVIAKFKGAPLLLDSFRIRRSRGDLPAAKLLLAGPQDATVREMLGASPYREAIVRGDIVAIDRFLTEEEMYLAAAACDLVVAPYPRHQNRSSIILWAAAAGRPCLATDDSCVGYVIRKERLGFTCNVLDTAAMAASISTAIKSPWTEVDVDRVREYASFHRMENYQALSSALVRERLAGSEPNSRAASPSSGGARSMTTPTPGSHV